VRNSDAFCSKSVIRRRAKRRPQGAGICVADLFQRAIAEIGDFDPHE